MQVKLAIFSPLALFIFVTNGAAESYVFRSDSHRYDSRYPSGWSQRADRIDLEITNYAIDQDLHGGLLAPGGARIQAVLKPEKLAGRPLEDWINYNLSVAEPNEIVSRSHSGDSLTEIHLRIEVGPSVKYEQFSSYFHRGGRDLAVGLEYRQGDPNEKEYRRAYEAVIKSLRVW